MTPAGSTSVEIKLLLISEREPRQRQPEAGNLIIKNGWE